jgi:2-polyprenyl-3-methyl-5-hydroxy-6-metoxy-1,4-benzoquinol methylase
VSADRAILESIACPYCGGAKDVPWAEERGFRVVRCASCRLIYVNPRPTLGAIEQAVRTGAHGAAAPGLEVTARRVPGKVRRYEKVLAGLFSDLWAGTTPVSWLDVGAGYGELLEAVSKLAPPGSRLEGLEPMRPKALAARQRGLAVIEDYLRPTHPKVQVISFVDVYSHVPDFRTFLADVRAVLEPGGEIFMETGNLADLDDRSQFPGELGVPDHLVFAGEEQLRGYLADAGFEIAGIVRHRVDGAVNFAKIIAKKILGRPAQLRLPYTSRYRQLLIRARSRPQ